MLPYGGTTIADLERVSGLPEGLSDLGMPWPPDGGRRLPGADAHILGWDRTDDETSGDRYEVGGAWSQTKAFYYDPVCLRLGLLRDPLAEDVVLHRDTFDDVAGLLWTWRQNVAAWAAAPPAPAPAEPRDRMLAVLSDGLDIPLLIDELHHVGCSRIPDGAKFALFQYADDILGLDLTRLVHDPPAPYLSD